MNKIILSVILIAAIFVGNDSFASFQCVSLFSKQTRNQKSVAKMTDVVFALKNISAEKELQYFVDSDPTELLDPEYGFQSNLKNSIKEPTHFINKINEMAGGLAAFQYHIFAEGYFRQVKINPEQPSAVSTKELAQTQPWLEWSHTEKKYTLKHGQLAKALLTPYLNSDGETVTLYRGARDEEIEYFKILKTQNLENSQTIAGLNKLFSKKDALFFTPDKQAALGWSDRKPVLAMTFRLSDLIESYAGIEYSYVEVAIFDPKVLAQGLATMTLAQ